MITRDLLPLAKPISMFTPDPANARKHDERSYEVVANSLRQFGQRKPIVAQEKDGQFIVRAGNGTLEAAKRLGWTEIAAVIVNEDSVTSTAYAIADNQTALVSSWDDEVLNKTLKALADEGVHVEDFGFDLDDFELSSDDKDKISDYTQKIEAPIYKPTGPKPELSDLVDFLKRDKLIEEIDSSKLPENEKHFLKLAAQRHLVFNYQNIAEYYAHSSKETQDLFEKSALVIIDFDKAIENGFVKLSNELSELAPSGGADVS